MTFGDRSLDQDSGSGGEALPVKTWLQKENSRGKQQNAGRAGENMEAGDRTAELCERQTGCFSFQKPEIHRIPHSIENQREAVTYRNI